jgi:hypothetical protein
MIVFANSGNRAKKGRIKANILQPLKKDIKL